MCLPQSVYLCFFNSHSKHQLLQHSTNRLAFPIVTVLCVAQTDDLCTMPWIRRAVTSLKLQRLGFVFRSGHARSVVENVKQTGFFLSTVGFPLSATCHQWSTLILILYVLPTRRSNRQSLGTLHKAMLVHVTGGTGLLLVLLYC